jgi:hypothetical protein
MCYKVTQEAGLEQSLFGSQVRQTKPLLQTVNTQHHCQIKRRAPRLGHRRMRGDQCQQLTPRHGLLHLVEQNLFAGTPITQIKAKVFLFHAVIDCNLRAPVKSIGAEF